MDRKRISDAVAAAGSSTSKRQRLIHPVRFVFFSAGIWKDFPAEISSSLGSAYAAGRKFVEILLASCHIAVCFVHMIQLDAGTGYKNSIGWFDSSGEFFCPIKTVDGPGSIDEVQELLRRRGKNSLCLSALQASGGVPTDTAAFSAEGCGEVDDVKTSVSNNVASKIKGDRERVGEDEDEEGKVDPRAVGGKVGGEVGEFKGGEAVGDGDEPVLKDGKLPSALAVASGGKLQALHGGDPKLCAVRAAFLAGLGKLAARAEVTGVHEVSYDSPGGRARLEAFKKLEELTTKVRGGDANLRLGWYGCGREELLSIIKHGFGRPSVDSTYGVGIYLRPEKNSLLSCVWADIDENGELHVMLCRAVLGKAELVRAGSKQFHPSSVLVDTGVDNLSNPKRFIVWSTQMNTHILPAFVVSFKHPLATYGRAKPGNSLKEKGINKEKAIKTFEPKTQSGGVSLPMLFAVLKPEVSSSEMDMIQQDYSELKNGKLSREGFLKRVRALIGDEKLRKIHEQMLRSSVLCGFLLCQSQNKLAMAVNRLRGNADIEI